MSANTKHRRTSYEAPARVSEVGISRAEITLVVLGSLAAAAAIALAILAAHVLPVVVNTLGGLTW